MDRKNSEFRESVVSYCDPDIILLIETKLAEDKFLHVAG